jgi:CRISPR-associated helicase Cas3
MLDAWNEHSAFVLVTKTGTGKTIAAVLPVLKNRQKAICVYPTNELIRDQVVTIQRIAEREGLLTCIYTPETSAEEYASADVILLQIDAHILEIWRKKLRLPQKWQVLPRLLLADKPKIVLTNPDILFLIFALRYHAESWAAVQDYDTLIVDEFHLYSGVELAHALFTLHMARNIRERHRIVLLSATPAPEVEEYLARVLDSPLRVDASTACCHPIVGQRCAVHSVHVIPKLAGQDVVEAAIAVLRELREDIFRLRGQKGASDYVPAVVVMNSVVNAIRLEDRLVEEGFSRDDMAIIRGLSSREVRNTSGKLLAIGTAAIEVGIDFQCDYLVFEASEAPQFMQRFGRVGRHNPGVAYVLCPHNVLAGIEALSAQKGQQVERGELEERVYTWYPSPDSRAWFVRSLMGLLSAFTLGESLIKAVRNDFRVQPKQLADIEAQIEGFYTTYCNKLGCGEGLQRKVLWYIRKARAGEKDFEWLRVYRDLNTFRTSLPSEWVLDFAEKRRRNGDMKKAKYQADVATLLRRAEGIRFDEKIRCPDGKKGIIRVRGYGKYKQVGVLPTFTDDDCGFPRCTSEIPDLCFLQDGKVTPLSRVMSSRPHVFAVFPKTSFAKLDWRLPVFDCGKHVIAFDGTALLLCEMYARGGFLQPSQPEFVSSDL